MLERVGGGCVGFGGVAIFDWSEWWLGLGCAIYGRVTGTWDRFLKYNTVYRLCCIQTRLFSYLHYLGALLFSYCGRKFCFLEGIVFLQVSEKVLFKLSCLASGGILKSVSIRLCLCDACVCSTSRLPFRQGCASSGYLLGIVLEGIFGTDG